MNSSTVLQHLGLLSCVTTLAVAVVALLRAPMRGLAGARAVCWLWLAVPASALALALPPLGRQSAGAVALAPDLLGWVWVRAAAWVHALHIQGPVGAAACAVWVTGASAAFALAVMRQRSFTRSLGTLVPLPDGTWRSRGVGEPMLIGALRPRVLVPWDFERRYGAEERELVLAHERAHVRRRDTLVNACCVAWLCAFWFNPVMLWAVRLLRFDQDLACDAAVLAAAGKGRRRRYAGALLKAQLAGEAALPLPLACHWRSVHPLRRRIEALRRPAAGRLRHGIGVLCASVLVASVSLGAHALEASLRSARPIAPADAARGTSAPAARPSSGNVCPLSRLPSPRHQPQRRTRA